MREIILLKLGELVLKGLNRHTFEEQLMSNARRRLRLYGEFKVYTKQSITYVEPRTDECDMDKAFEAMKKTFGANHVCRCYPCEKDKDAMLAGI